MPSSLNADNGVVSGTAGLKSSADSSGVLDLQTNGTTAISISASQVVSFANQPTYTGGTANGVMFLNGSKAVTTGTALTFDGSQLDIPLGSAGTPSLSTPTDPNTGMFFPAADTIAFAEGGVEAMRLDSSGNMGVGTTSPVARLDVSGGSIRVNEDGVGTKILTIRSNWAGVDPAINVTTSNALLLMTANTERARISSTGNFLINTTGNGSPGLGVANSANISFPESTDNTSIATMFRQSNTADLVLGSGVRYSSTASGFASSFNGAWARSAVNVGYGAIKFFTAAEATVAVGTDVTMSERARITSTGVLDLATGAGAVGQIQFPATQVASANANTLDDYEEGTWTPVITGSGGGTLTYNFISGVYRKVGSMVYVQFGVNVASRSGGSGEILINGLPFTSIGRGAYQEPSNPLQGGGWATAALSGRVYMFVMDSSAQMRTRYLVNTDTFVSFVEIQAGTYLNGIIVYCAAN